MKQNHKSIWAEIKKRNPPHGNPKSPGWVLIQTEREREPGIAWATTAETDLNQPLEATDLIRGNVSIEHLYYALNICVRPGNICVQLAANSRD